MSHNGGYGALREDVMANARERTRQLASEGLSAYEIESRLKESLTRTEQELLRVVIRSEVNAARRNRVAQSLEPGSGSVEATRQ